ncbi:helix-turn-helix domain-containing protein [Prescottella equi]|uniref:helix-turn-helix domain-containing protein n=1 Tax=Rhodococcus hoagii TaxID=43767 RepID=UPI001EECE760|nr:helix-turn-helix transcriptional regulator [Prescottella equi]
MTSPFELPEPWATALREAGLVDPTRDNPSLNALSRATGITTATLSKIVKGEYGRRGPSADNIEKIADALETQPAVVAQWVNRAWESSKPRDLPSDAKFLTDKQWALVVDMIKAFADTQRTLSPTNASTDNDRKPGRPKTTRQQLKRRGKN